MPRDSLVFGVDDAHFEGRIGVFVVPVEVGIGAEVGLYFLVWGWG